MIRQRWGTFSVIDAQDPARLTPEVLLYDKLVIPVPKTVHDHNRWEQEGWLPGVQGKFLKTLGDLVVRTRWGEEEQLDWARRYEDLQRDLHGIVEESKRDVPFQLTRMVLAQKSYPLPEGVDDIDAITAFQSESGFRAFFEPDAKALAMQELGMKLRHRMAVPWAGKYPHGTLASVVALASEADFLQKRSRVYQKQDHILSGLNPSLDDVQELEQLSEELADYIKLMLTNVSYTHAFTVAAIPPGYASGRPFQAYTAKSASLSSVLLRANLPVLALRPGSAPPKAVYHN
jgi:hypothetical protein